MTDASQSAGVLLPGFVGTELPAWLAARLRAGLAGVCVFGANIESAHQLRALTDEIYACNPRALIAIDEEGGDVTRLHYRTGSPLPGNAWLGRRDDLELTRRTGASIAGQLRAVGCNLNFAPSADVNANPANPVIGVRSFGADAELVARHTSAWVRGHQSAGVAVSVKHFPGHGDTDTDSHLALPVVDRSLAELRERELVPFAAAAEAGAWTVMSSHILLPQLDPDRPATFSPAVLGGVLRDELGFEGVVVSDALDMVGASGEIGIPEAAIRALAGGCDLLCIGAENTDEQLAEIEASIERAVLEGRLPATRVADAAQRVAALGASLAAHPGRPVETSGCPDPPRLVEVFDVRPDARRLVEAVGGTASWVVVQLHTRPNIVAGVAPWGVAAALADSGRWPVEHRPAVVVDVDAEAAEGLAVRLGDVPLLVIGRNLHQHDWITRLIAELRASHSQLVTVEMGWPDEAAGGADITTFGASPALGAALLWLLDRPARGTV